jgi:hypothetical protein
MRSGWSLAGHVGERSPDGMQWQCTAAAGRITNCLAVALPKGAWQWINCWDGAKGRRCYDWAIVATSRVGLEVRVSVS